ncbi:hypothetical protein FACS1894180_6130 [Bacteroidia bacterium]|nr:hypothetical protein FACS1894180_6130 [Bacteroidia bacterium]
MEKEIVKKSISLFSAETLDSLAMAEITGGQTVNNCNGGNCAAGCGQPLYPQCTELPSNYGICSPVPINVTACIYWLATCSNIKLSDSLDTKGYVGGDVIIQI